MKMTSKLAMLAILSATFATRTARADGTPTAPPAEPAAMAPQATAAPGTTVAISFGSGSANDKYNVVVVDATGAKKSCDAPCSLDLAPGPAHLSVTGTRSYEQDISIEGKPAHVALTRPCPMCLTVGGAMLGLGAVFIVLGQLQHSAADSPCSSSELSCESDRNGKRVAGTFYTGVGIASLVASATALAVFVIQGSPRAEVKRQGSAPRVRLENVGVAPVPIGSGAVGGLALSF